VREQQCLHTWTCTHSTYHRQERSTTKRHIASILSILVVVWTLVPYQVAFLATFFLHIASASTPRVPPPTSNSYVRLTDRSRSPARSVRSRSPSISPSLATLKLHQGATRLAQDEHLLLLLLWLLPFAAPVLAVWVRTLQTAGFTIPFDGDHNILSVLPWLLLGEAAASRRPLRPARNRGQAIATTCVLSSVPLLAVLVGPRYPFVVYEAATVGAAWLAVTRIEWKRI
jgi:glycosylphosphatidylinositol deacylase